MPRAASPGSAPTSSTSCAAIPTEDSSGRRQVWGRRHGPRLRPGRQALLETRLPALAIALPTSGRLDPAGLFAAPRDIWLEIGFGGGEHLAALAERHPDVGFIGVEPFVNGVARLLALAEAAGIGNIRVLSDDARLLLTALPDASLGRAFVLFPDPWPKLRHHKRRIVNPRTMAELARTIRPGGELRLATDDADYARAMLETVLHDGRFVWQAMQSDDWLVRPEDWPATRYEEKALAAGRRPVYLRFVRSG
jgi:tRNA (guanine-N7-)-methyltransferase